ncbi:hypothetical protein ACIA8K_10065 [Catenuloplanes sp. NPDC051500]|uniref:hypothetical protein n=1 Tax=Catenuloplanes sp. NPDC051500 TaxID=3363959 RepID=UPI0037AFE9A1
MTPICLDRVPAGGVDLHDGAAGLGVPAARVVQAYEQVERQPVAVHRAAAQCRGAAFAVEEPVQAAARVLVGAAQLLKLGQAAGAAEQLDVQQVRLMPVQVVAEALGERAYQRDRRGEVATVLREPNRRRIETCRLHGDSMTIFYWVRSAPYP